mgnify:CR=1 FL=1
MGEHARIIQEAAPPGFAWPQQADIAIKLFQQKHGNTPGGFKLEWVKRDLGGPNGPIYSVKVRAYK